MLHRPSAHTRAINEAKVREQYTCQLCGSQDQIEGHHVIDYGFGGEAATENILVTCKECHGEIHHGKIRTDTLDFR